MKKVKKFITKNIKLLVGITIGLIISGTCVYASTILYQGNNVSFDNTNANLTLNNQPVDNMQDAMDALYTKVQSEIPPCAFKLGDYISLTPDATTFTIYSGLTGYTSDQTITPNELTLWRVIDIHSDGSFDAISEYVSSTAVYFRGATGYANFVGGLQTIAASYAKPGYTIATRMMGYNGQTPTIQPKASSCTGTCQTTTTYAFDGSTTAAPTSTSTLSPTTIDANNLPQEYLGGVGGDTLYLKDYQLVSNVYKEDTATYGSTGLKAYNVSSTSSAKAYWLASRRFNWSAASDFYFSGRFVSTSGGLYGNALRTFGYSWRDYSYSYSLRPILTLKSGLAVSGGSGIKTSPYTLSG